MFNPSRISFCFLAACVGVGGLLTASPVDARELVTNGSFESGTFNNNGQGGDPLPLGSTDITGWTVISDEIAWINNVNAYSGVTATDGVFSLDLTGFTDFPPHGGVTQNLTTVIGQKYALTFDLGVNTAYGSSVAVQASVGGVSSVFNFDAPQAGQSWSKKVVTFTATDVSTTLSLTGTQANQYIGLDNVSVNELVGTTIVAESVGLITGEANKQKVGTFAGGEQIRIQFGGNGDLVNANFQVRSDGSLFAPAAGPYTFANEGATNYPTNLGGDGINHYVGGGANFDGSGSGLPFAGKATTDTFDPATIRLGAVVGTFNPNPTRDDWFFIGSDTTFFAPIGGGSLFLAINDTFSSDNHGTFTGTLSVIAPTVVPEANTASLSLLGGAFGLVVCGILRRKRVAA